MFLSTKFHHLLKVVCTLALEIQVWQRQPAINNKNVQGQLNISSFCCIFYNEFLPQDGGQQGSLPRNQVCITALSQLGVGFPVLLTTFKMCVCYTIGSSFFYPQCRYKHTAFTLLLLKEKITLLPGVLQVPNGLIKSQVNVVQIRFLLLVFLYIYKKIAITNDTIKIQTRLY